MSTSILNVETGNIYSIYRLNLSKFVLWNTKIHFFMLWILKNEQFLCVKVKRKSFLHMVLAWLWGYQIPCFNLISYPSRRKSSGERKELWLQWFYKPLQILFKGLLYLYNNIPTAENKCQLNLLLGFIPNISLELNLLFFKTFLKGLIGILVRPKMSKSCPTQPW